MKGIHVTDEAVEEARERFVERGLHCVISIARNRYDDGDRPHISVQAWTNDYDRISKMSDLPIDVVDDELLARLVNEVLAELEAQKNKPACETCGRPH